MKRLVAWLSLMFVSTLAFGQVTTAPPLIGARGTTLPGTCIVGQLFFKTDATPGSNVYECASTNTWTQEAGGGALSNAFTSVPVSGQTTVTASGATALTLIAGTNMTITTDNTAKSVTLTATNSGGGVNVGASNLNFNIANASVTGTTVNRLAKLTGAPSTAVITATTDTENAVGVVISGAGTTGTATIAIMGQVSCDFDGSTTAGNYVIISTSTAGKCSDAGSTWPTTGAVYGRVLSSNVGAGTYSMELMTPDVAFQNAGNGKSKPGGNNTTVQYNNSNQFGGITAVTYESLGGGIRLTAPAMPTLTGTATSVGTAVTGTGTLFTTELVVGDKIYISGDTSSNASRAVVAIADNTHLTTDSAFSPTLSATTLKRSSAILRQLQPDGSLGLVVGGDGQIYSYGSNSTYNSGFAFSNRTDNKGGGTIYSPAANSIWMFDDTALVDVFKLDAGALTIPRGSITSGSTSVATGSLVLKGITSGTAILTVGAAAGTPTITLPTTTGTLALLGANTFTASQNITASTNGSLEFYVQNNSNGNAALGMIRILNDANAWMGWQKYSTGYTTSGLVVASLGGYYNTTGASLFSNTTSSDFIWARGGSAATNEVMRLAAGVLSLGVAGTTVGSLSLFNATSGSVTFTPVTGALGTITVTVPALTGTMLVGSAVNAVSPTSPNRTITIVHGGTTYYIAAKTTND